MGEAIIAKVLSGEYKDKEIRIVFGPTPSTTEIFLNGKKSLDFVSIWIDIHKDDDANVMVLRKKMK